jgi:L-ascorbate metabolism protein UlaG (beta-lactamase superfamily)
VNFLAKITYLFHSGYAVETASHLLIFDYYQPGSHTSGSLDNGIITSEYLKTKSNVYVFASHNHADHFDPIILKWGKTNPAITYILSSDIKLAAPPANCRFLSEHEDFKDDSVFIKAFGSTDQGVSFLVQTDGVNIFHAGDLNWWRWKGHNQKEQTAAEAAFKTVITAIIGYSIDVAFFPVDRRLEEFFASGAEYFAAVLQPKLLLPMHFGKDFGASKAFSKIAQKSLFQTVEITHKGQEIIF